jgi:ATP-binding cassette subfamily F protein 3
MIADNRTLLTVLKVHFQNRCRNRVKMLEKLVIVQVDEVDTSALKLKFPPAARSGQYPVIVKICQNHTEIMSFSKMPISLLKEVKSRFRGEKMKENLR